MPPKYSPAVAEHTAEYVALRGMTRQNAISEERLRSMGITAETWAQDIRTGELTGHICRQNGKVVGYCFGSRKDGEIVVLAILPSSEGQGIGKELLALVVRDLKRLGHTRQFLGCSLDPRSRSHGFYRHLGWRTTGNMDKYGDEILELHTF
jgi:GNAT superfamily N-acetyltransferase